MKPNPKKTYWHWLTIPSGQYLAITRGPFIVDGAELIVEQFEAEPLSKAKRELGVTEHVWKEVEEQRRDV